MKKLLLILLGLTFLNAQDYKKLFDPNSTYFDTGTFTIIFSNAQNQEGIDPAYDLYKNIPFRTIAVNPHKIIPGNVLFIPQFIGVKLPDGSYHDGYFFAHKILNDPKVQSIKIFVDKNQPNPFVEKDVTRADVYEARGTMAKTMRLRFKLQYAKQQAKPTYKMVAAEFTNLMHEGNKKMGSVSERIQKYSELGRGTPYLIYNLGEGAGSKIDPDPTIDFARTDCMTFCEHTLALAISDNYPEMYNNLQKIRYKKGEVEYTARNHFTIADWLPNNNWLLEDVTTEVAPGLTKKMDKTIDRPTFYKNNGVPAAEIKKAPQKEKLTVDYVPEENLLKMAPNLEGGEIVSIVTTNPVVVSAHMGIIIRDEWDNLIFRHASSSQSTNEVMDVRFEQIVESLKKSKSRVGMIFMRAREDFKIPE